MMEQYINYLQALVSTDFTSESDFLGASGRWCNDQVTQGAISLLPSALLGAKDSKGAVIGIERLMNNSFVELSPKAVGLYVPADDIVKRTNYQWFARMSAKQVLESDTTIGKYLVQYSGV